MLQTSILKKLRRPGRYLGTEIHSIHKKWKRGHISFCLAFPDLYEIGMSHPGLQILYHAINQFDTAVCERVFAPAHDLESELLQIKKNLCSLESNVPLRKFDIVGFSLQYELCYSNIITMLSLGGIPVFASDRKNGPLIIAGGPCSVNPEPVADFIDIFIIGDGEEVVKTLIQALATHKKRYRKIIREQLFKDIVHIDGVYIPAFYDVAYDKKTGEKCITPKESGIPLRIKKAVFSGLNGSYYPCAPIVPYIQTVHDRACVEIMRGCPHVCKFCQARHYYYPLRRRSMENILADVQAIIDNTGYDEISLLSLSSGDYPKIEELLQKISELFVHKNIALSLPSIRVERLIKLLPYYLSQQRKTGLTFAPEAGSERLRTVIGKKISMTHLYDAARAAFTNGYRHIKLYFMIGLPTETYEDIDAIVDLVYAIAKVRLEISKKPAQVNVTIGNFIPKPHTPFEREKMDSPDIIQEKQAYLRQKLKKRYIKYNFTQVPVSLLEAVFARGDRRLGTVIYQAWKNGARFDAWHEHFQFERWQNAFLHEGIDLVSLATRERSAEEHLPWEHIQLVYNDKEV